MPIALTHTPGEWDGTYAATLRYLLADILDDGEPVRVDFYLEVGPDVTVLVDRLDGSVASGKLLVDSSDTVGRLDYVVDLNEVNGATIN